MSYDRQILILAQMQLKNQGFYTGQIDGIPGPLTRRALNDWQRSTHVPPTPITKDPPWLKVAIGEMELGVDQIRGAQHNPRIIEYHQCTTLRATTDETPWCFTGDTEILTERGWIRFDILGSEKVAQVVPNTHEVQFVEPINKIVKYYEGELIEIRNTGLNLISDPNHQYYGIWNGLKRNNGEPKSPAKHSLSNLTSYLSIPTVRSGKPDDPRMSDWDLRFLAAFLSDGSGPGKWPTITFQVSRPRKLEELDRLGPRSKSTNPSARGRTKVPLTEFRFPIPQFFEWVFDDYKQPSWDLLLSLSQRQLKLLLEEYSIFDGSQTTETSRTLYTASPYLKDWLIAAVGLAGYVPNISKGVSKLSGRDYWSIRWSSEKQTKTIRPGDLHYHYASTTLYCVEVPSGLIYIRDSEGRPVVTGNCSSFINWVILQVGIEPTRSAAARSWLVWGKSLDEPRRGCIVIFSRGRNPSAGHVGLYMTEEHGRIMVLGGNQSNTINISPYKKENVLGYRWPKGHA